MVVHYYHSQHLSKDYEPVPNWTSNWESPDRDSDYEYDIDIDGPDHTKDYMAWWQEHRPDYIGIHAPGPVEEVIEEDIDDVQDGWNAPDTRLGWDGRPSLEVQDASLDACHYENDEMDLDQDDYELEVANEVDDTDEDDDDDDDDDEDGNLLTL